MSLDTPSAALSRERERGGESIKIQPLLHKKTTRQTVAFLKPS